MAGQTIIQRIAMEGGEAIRRDLKGIADSIGSIGESFRNLSGPEKLQRIEESARSFGGAIRDTSESVGGFVASMAKIGAAAAVAGGAVALVGKKVLGSALALASGLTAQKAEFRESDKILRQQIKTQADAARSALEFALNFEEANDRLRGEALSGKITWDQYRASLIALEEQRDRDLKKQRLLTALQEDEQRLNEKLLVQQREKQALQALELKVGPQIANSLLSLGLALENLRQRFIQTFGPVISGILDKFTSLIRENGENIVGMFNSVAGASSPLATALSTFLERAAKVVLALGEIATKVLIGIIIPGFVKLLEFLDKVAAGLNSVFGGKFTAEGLVAAAILLKLTGAFGVLLNTIRLAASGIQLLFFLLSAGPAGLAVVAVLAVVAGVVILVNALGGIEGISQMWNDFWAMLTDLGQRTVDAVVGFFTSIPERITAGVTAMKDLIVAAWDFLITKAREIIDGIVLAFKNGWESLAAGVTTFLQPIVNAFNQILDLAKRVGKAISEVIGGPKKAATASSGFAGGGLVRGPGTGTSDSILARVSNREFVHREAAVRKYGVPFMAAINKGKISLEAVQALMQGLRGFSGGGLAASMSALALPRFATGGLVTATPARGGRPVNLTIGGETFGLLAPDEDVAGRLINFASRARVRSAGRRPGWYGG